MKEKKPCIMIAAANSGSGKTIVTCGLLQLLKNHGKNPAAFKCGPDYIDPMFHARVLGIPSRNLDTYLTDSDTVKYLYQKTIRKQRADITVIEGVMGYYDGVAMTTTASTYELALTLQVPVILVIDVKGMGNSIVALLKGYLMYQNPSYLAGVILNRVSSNERYLCYKKIIEKELPLKAIGYVPIQKEAEIQSRHLGLQKPDEIIDLRERIQKLAGVMEQTIDLKELLNLADQAGKLEETDRRMQEVNYCHNQTNQIKQTVRVALALDEAFCFYYQDNLELLEEYGAQIVPFSPLHDTKLPENIQGLLLGGGYPELYVDELCANISMHRAIRACFADGMPCLAECGGFMYLKETLEGCPMVNVLQGNAFSTKKLSRFGYVELTANEDTILGPAGTKIKAHEFHYFDTTENGSSFTAKKPLRDKSWTCIQTGKNYVAGFPHLYFYSNKKAAKNFMQCCMKYGRM